MKIMDLSESESGRKNSYRRIILVCFVLYVAMIASKNLFTSEIIEIIKEYGITKSKASLATTFYFVSYAFSQLFISKIITKINIVKTTLVMMLVSVGITTLIPFCSDIRQIYALFLFNGIAQTTVWPSCILILSEYLPERLKMKGCKTMSIGYSVAFTLDYAMASFCFRFATWKLGFWIFSTFLLIGVLFFYFVISNTTKISETAKKEQTTENISKIPKSTYFWLVTVVLVGAFLSNFIYQGVLTWIPNLLYDCFNVSSSRATIVTMIVPFAVTLGPIISMSLCDKYNHWKICLVLCLVSMVIPFVLSGVYNKNATISIMIILIFLIIFRAICNIFGTVVPVKGNRFINSGSFAALVNTAASFGFACGGPVVGKAIDTVGWSMSYIFIGFVIVLLIFTVLLKFRSISRINKGIN